MMQSVCVCVHLVCAFILSMSHVGMCNRVLHLHVIRFDAASMRWGTTRQILLWAFRNSRERAKYRNGSMNGSPENSETVRWGHGKEGVRLRVPLVDAAGALLPRPSPTATLRGRAGGRIAARVAQLIRRAAHRTIGSPAADGAGAQCLHGGSRGGGASR